MRPAQYDIYDKQDDINDSYFWQKYSGSEIINSSTVVQAGDNIKLTLQRLDMQKLNINGLYVQKQKNFSLFM